jgi:hypothetical protein
MLTYEWDDVSVPVQAKANREPLLFDFRLRSENSFKKAYLLRIKNLILVFVTEKR